MDLIGKNVVVKISKNENVNAKFYGLGLSNGFTVGIILHNNKLELHK